MITDAVRKKYRPTIGIETHVQLKTKTKLFAAVGNDAREAPPNTLISHICVGMPGALPVLNKAAIEMSVRAAFALNTKPQSFSKFERKHYFYPDLPKGYQITQYEDPIIAGGNVEIIVSGGTKKIGIERANLEEDAGKNTHPAGADYTLVDLNRAGTPLLEIVSQPDIHSAVDAKAFAHELYLLMKHADVTDGDLYHGHLRFDINVSVSPDSKLGTRSEVKNLNSFRSIEAAVAYEIDRQIELLEKGQKVVQETRGWDEAKQKTIAQRTKEEAHDYRYMPEPDIPPVELENNFVTSIKKTMPKLPSDWREILSTLNLDEATTETLISAEADGEGNYLEFIEQRLDKPDEAKFLVNWYVNLLIPLIREGKFTFNRECLNLASNIYKLVKAGKLSSTNAKSLYIDLLHKNFDAWPKAIEKYAEEKGYIQLSNEGEIDQIVSEVLAENPQVVDDIKAGQKKAVSFLVGQVMAKSKGRANPQLTQELIKKRLKI